MVSGYVKASYKLLRAYPQAWRSETQLAHQHMQVSEKQRQACVSGPPPGPATSTVVD